MRKWNRKMILLYGISLFAARFQIGGAQDAFGGVLPILHPFVMALFGGLCLEWGLPRKLSFLVLLAGVAAAGQEDMLLQYGISMLVVMFIAGMAEGQWLFGAGSGNANPERKRLSLTSMALLNGIVTAVIRAGGSFPAIERGWMLAVLEGVLAAGLTVVLQKGIHFFLYPSEREEPDGREMIGTVLLILAALCGLPEIGGISLVYPGAVLAVLYLGFHYGIGAGAIAGALVGMVMGIQTGKPEAVGCFALFGLICATLRELGRIPVALTWLMLSACAGFVWDDFFISREGLLGTLPALILFLLLPKRKTEEKQPEEEPVFTNMQAVTRERLREISSAFRKLSELMAYPPEPRRALTGGELNRIFNLVSEKCCAGCEKRQVCMKSEFYDTYHDVFQILNQAEKKGQIELADVPEMFLTRCIQPEYFLMETGRSLELARTNLAWQNRLAENRVVVAEQFAGVAGMMEEVVTGLGMGTLTRNEDEIRVRECVGTAGLQVCQAAVKKREDGRSEIFLTARIPDGGCMTTRDLAELLGHALDRSFHSSFSSKAVVSGEWATLTFLEDTAFRFYSGVASCPREGEARSGDSHSVQELPRGEAVLLLSDGMGSGSMAAEESARMVELLEQFLDAGLESTAAMRLIQSSMFLRGSGDGCGTENFTSVDLFRVDLCSGICRYLKIGAADSFLVRGDRIERLTYTSLPAGILTPQETEEQTVKLYEGDFLIMVTDGFLECFEEGQAEEIILSVIAGRRQNNTTELARILLDSAQIHCGGSPADDVTVMVTGFWENEKVATDTARW